MSLRPWAETCRHRHPYPPNAGKCDMATHNPNTHNTGQTILSGLSTPAPTLYIFLLYYIYPASRLATDMTLHGRARGRSCV
jgi:hypothetical protein